MHSKWQLCLLFLLSVKSVQREACLAVNLDENSAPSKNQDQAMGKSASLKILHG